MHALDKKVLRDLRLMWSQAITIALVVASGIGGFMASLSAVESLDLARDRFYRSNRFADVFMSVKRAPLAIRERLQQLPGVAEVHTTVESSARITVAGSPDPVVGQLIGLEAGTQAGLNRVSLRSGQWPQARGSDLEALVSEGFAKAHGLRLGDSVTALVNGKRRRLVICGLALSPEYVFAGLMGMPDLRAFGVFWLDARSLAGAIDMQGAFNHAALRLQAGAAEAPCAQRWTRFWHRTAGRWPGAEASKPRTPCWTTKSVNNACWAPCCRPSSWVWRPFCCMWWSPDWSPPSGNRSQRSRPWVTVTPASAAITSNW